MEPNEKLQKKFKYGKADFGNNKIIILNQPSDNSDIIEDNSVINPLNFDQIIESSNKKYISYITLSGIRRYSLISDGNNKIINSIEDLDSETYKWNIFKIYKNHYIDNYTPPKEILNNKKSLSKFINTLYINLQPKALGLCAQFIHWALNVAGFKFKGKYNAKLYHLEGLMKELGFEEINKNENGELKKGDIVVIVDYNLAEESNYYGHICAWDGKYWLCDGKAKKLNQIKNAHFYRYNFWEE